MPLVVLTADRPPELRDTGAGQAIDQVKLYGDVVKWFVEVDVGEATPERLRWIRALACRAVWTALERRAGPVHLNVPLREPLVLDEPLEGDRAAGGRADGRPWVVRAPATGDARAGRRDARADHGGGRPRGRRGRPRGARVAHGRPLAAGPAPRAPSPPRPAGRCSPTR